MSFDQQQLVITQVINSIHILTNSNNILTIKFLWLISLIGITSVFSLSIVTLVFIELIVLVICVVSIVLMFIALSPLILFIPGSLIWDDIFNEYITNIEHETTIHKVLSNYVDVAQNLKKVNSKKAMFVKLLLPLSIVSVSILVVQLL